MTKIKKQLDISSWNFDYVLRSDQLLLLSNLFLELSEEDAWNIWELLGQGESENIVLLFRLNGKIAPRIARIINNRKKINYYEK